MYDGATAVPRAGVSVAPSAEANGHTGEPWAQVLADRVFVVADLLNLWSASSDGSGKARAFVIW